MWNILSNVPIQFCHTWSPTFTSWTLHRNLWLWNSVVLEIDVKWYYNVTLIQIPNSFSYYHRLGNNFVHSCVAVSRVYLEFIPFTCTFFSYKETIHNSLKEAFSIASVSVYAWNGNLLQLTFISACFNVYSYSDDVINPLRWHEKCVNLCNT